MFHKALPLLFSSILFLSTANAGRYEEQRSRAAKGPHLQVQAATFYGGAGDEGFVDAAELSDGRILAIGNRTGTSDGKTVAFVLAYSADLSRELGNIHLQPGEGQFTSGVLGPQGRFLYLAGTAGSEYRNLLQRVPRTQGKNSASCFLLALDVTSGQIAWVTGLDLKRSPVRTQLDHQGQVLVSSVRKGEAELIRVASADGTAGPTLRMQRSNRGGSFTPHPTKDSIFYGTDRNTHTGREPWRQPYFYEIDGRSIGKPKPEYRMKLWEWKPNEQIRGDGKDGAYQLESDSSITDAAFSADGSFFVSGWSDGGNSVFTRQPDSLEKKWSSSPLGISTWGMRGASGISWLMKLDLNTHQVLTGTQWVGFIPEGFEGGKGNWPNVLHIDQLAVLPNGSPAVTGQAWTGLPPTPNAFWLRPKEMSGKYAGYYVTVFTPELDRLLFSSYLPGYQHSRLIPVSDGILIVGTTTENDGTEDVMATPPSTRTAAQPQFGGGETDGHLIRLKLPPGL